MHIFFIFFLFQIFFYFFSFFSKEIIQVFFFYIFCVFFSFFTFFYLLHFLHVFFDFFSCFTCFFEICFSCFFSKKSNVPRAVPHEPALPPRLVYSFSEAAVKTVCPRDFCNQHLRREQTKCSRDPHGVCKCPATWTKRCSSAGRWETRWEDDPETHTSAG